MLQAFLKVVLSLYKEKKLIDVKHQLKKKEMHVSWKYNDYPPLNHYAGTDQPVVKLPLHAEC